MVKKIVARTLATKFYEKKKRNFGKSITQSRVNPDNNSITITSLGWEKIYTPTSNFIHGILQISRAATKQTIFFPPPLTEKPEK